MVILLTLISLHDGYVTCFNIGLHDSYNYVTNFNIGYAVYTTDIIINGFNLGLHNIYTPNASVQETATVLTKR